MSFAISEKEASPMVDERSERVINALDAYTKKTTASAKDARNALVREGIYYKSGKLNKNYTLPKDKKS
jgi:hypothetical protein